MASASFAILSSTLLAPMIGCDPPPPTPRATESATAATEPEASDGAAFRDVSSAVGLDFEHVNGASGEFYFPEIMGSGAALFDYDNDGDLDVFLVQGGYLGPSRPEGRDRPGNELYRNDRVPARDGISVRFEKVTREAGVGHGGYGMGVAVGDYDNDGYLDFYVTNFGANALYHNEGNGTFAEVGRDAGVDDARWGTSATFLDFDRDGFLDLFVANYVDFAVSSNTVCRPAGVRDYCHPSNFEPEADILYRNLGDGTFEDVTASAGLGEHRGNGLGVAALDFDEDGWIDVYVANDGNENSLWKNLGNGGFEDVALFNGVALNGDGAAEAGMGVAVDDFDRDGDTDLFVTHLRDETNTLYANAGDGFFEDATFLLGLGYPSLATTGFGVQWLDYDNDGLSDLFCANGAVAIAGGASSSAASAYAEPNHLFRNVAGRSFDDVTASGGRALALVEVSRGAAFGDVDDDGDVDVLVSNNGGPARLLLNQVGASRGWVSFTLRRATGIPQAFGARVTLVLEDGRRHSKVVRTDGSYCSASDLRVHFGLSDGAAVEGVEVAWPGAGSELFTSITLDRGNELVEGRGSRVSE